MRNKLVASFSIVIIVSIVSLITLTTLGHWLLSVELSVIATYVSIITTIAATPAIIIATRVLREKTHPIEKTSKQVITLTAEIEGKEYSIEILNPEDLQSVLKQFDLLKTKIATSPPKIIETKNHQLPRRKNYSSKEEVIQ